VEEASNALSTTQISALIPYVHSLNDELETFPTNVTEIKTMRSEMLAELNRRFWHFKDKKFVKLNIN
jgi:hypothetical protein